MANVDITLRLTNPALYNQLQALVSHPHEIALQLNPNSIQQIHGQLQNISVPVSVTPTLNNPQQLVQQIQQAIGNISINVTIGNLVALNTQIQQLFAGLGINAQNVGAGSPSGPTTLSHLLQRSVAQARLFGKTQALQARQSKQQREFESGSLLDIAILGPERAARLFEENKGLQAGSIGTQGLSRFSFDLKRPFATKAARNELGFATLFGGLPGFIGGVAGGAAFGEGGIFQGSAIFQQAVNTITSTFDSIAGVLLKASKAGQEFQEAVTSTSIALQATSKVVGPGGREASIGETIAFQNERSKSLLGKATEQLSPLGVKPETVAATLRGVIQGTARTGIPFSEDQILKQVFTIAAFTAKTNEDLAANSGRLANAAEGLVAGETTPTELTRSLLGSKVAAPLRAAIQTGDAEAATKVFDGLAKTIKDLSETSVTFNTALGQVDTQLQSFQREFGNAFNEALVPGLTEFAKALNNPAFKTALRSLGEDLGKLLNVIIQGAANITKFLSENPQLVKTGVAATGGALAGAATGATAGFFLGGLPGAAIGGLAGAAIGGLGGAIIGGKPIDRKAPPTTAPQNLTTVPIIREDEALGRISKGAFLEGGEGTILGDLTSGVLGLRKQKVGGELSEGAFQRGAEDLRIGAYVDLSNTLSKVELISNDLATSFTTLDLKINEANAALSDFSNARELEKLQGQEKLAAINRQIVEAGGTAKISIGGPSAFESEGEDKTRRLKILETQFSLESSKLDPFRFEDRSTVLRTEEEAKAGALRTSGLLDRTSQLGQLRNLVKRLPAGVDIDPSKLGISGARIEGRTSVNKEEVLRTIDENLESTFKEQGITGNLSSIDDLVDSLTSDKLSGEPLLKDINDTIKDLIRTLSDTVATGAAKALDGAFSNG